MATLIFYQRILYSRGWSCVSQHLRNISKPFSTLVGALFGSHCTKWADEQHRQAGFESRLVPDLPLPFIPTLIGLRAFDLVSSRVWWEAATNKRRAFWRSSLRRNPAFCAVAFTLPSGVDPTPRGWSAFLPPT